MNSADRLEHEVLVRKLRGEPQEAALRSAKAAPFVGTAMLLYLDKYSKKVVSPSVAGQAHHQKELFLIKIDIYCKCQASEGARGQNRESIQG